MARPMNRDEKLLDEVKRLLYWECNQGTGQLLIEPVAGEITIDNKTLADY